MSDLVPVKRALLSVSDKTGLKEFATALVSEFGVELISTGGTAKFLRDAGLKVTDVSDVTGFPEMMDGRVKTLHPMVHGGLLALRDNPEHAAAMQKHGIRPIDLVCVNLYPFKKTIERPGVTFEDAIENIDIGGPSMVRSAAKNHRFVLVVTDPDRYEKVLGDLRKHAGASCAQHRLKQAQRAFAHTAQYDATIAQYLEGVVDPPKEGKWQTGGPASFATAPAHGRIAALLGNEPQKSTTGAGTPAMVARLQSRSKDVASFLNDLVTVQAVAVGGTEAVAFLFDGPARDVRLNLIAHVRPDNASEEIRNQAIDAFRELIRPCAEQGKDAALMVGEGSPSQFCLVTMLRKGGDVAGVSAVIARAADQQAANQQLIQMQLVAGYYELLSPRTSVPSAAAAMPDKIDLHLTKMQALRYGENPHQHAALYVGGVASEEASVAFARQHHGKELSYINLLDADAAMSAVKELANPAACVVKHATPCGFATAGELPTAFKNAYEGDPLAAFGGIVALNKKVDLATAQTITGIDKLLEVIVAPAYDADALDLLRTRWKNVRLLEVPGDWSLARGDAEVHLHKIVGGYLVQQRDLTGLNESDWKVVSKRQPNAQELADLRVAWLACKHVKSNAIVLAKNGMMLGSGAGQQDRVNACRIAIQKAGDRAKASVAASDAFFPFPDGPQLLLDAGVTAIIHPGGSLRDAETTALVDQRNAALILTGQRHFKH